MAQNPAISLPYSTTAVEPLTFQEVPVAFQLGASGCFSRVLLFVACAVLVVGVVYGVQCLFATAGGF